LSDARRNGCSNGNSYGRTSPTTNSNAVSAPLKKAYLEGKAVRTVYGPVPLKYALDWPVFASYEELAGCANWMGGRIPTVEEARSIYSHVDGLKVKEAEQHLGKTVPAVNGYVHICVAGIIWAIVDTITVTSSMMESARARHHELQMMGRALKSSSPTLRVRM